MKQTGRFIILFIFVAAAGWLVWRAVKLPSLKQLLTAKEVSIDETVTVLKNIQSLSQLSTITAYDEIVVDSTAAPSATINPFVSLYHAVDASDAEIVLIGKAITYCGIDLQKLQPQDLYLSQDSVHLTLPAAQILEVALNPSDVEIFSERGVWNNNAMIRLTDKIKYLAAATAMSNGALGQAETEARKILTTFFNAAGYKTVVFEFVR